jgi:hypothetical protein
VAVAAFAAAVDSIHRLFEERKLLEEIRIASADGEPTAYETDQELEQQGSQFREYQGKQVVM